MKSMVRRTMHGSRGGWTRRSLVLAAVLTAAASPSLAGDDNAITPVALFHAAPIPEAHRPQAPFSLHVSPGDHIKVAFYERVGGLADGRAEQVSSAQLVERTELTGEYVVQLDGTVFVPLLGTVDIGSQSLPEAQQALASVFRSTTGRDVKIALSVASREPVYVTGAVSNPGTYAYTEGMTVLHAVALSGGLEGKGSELSRSFEIIRERERFEKAIDHIKRLFARRAVLNSEREPSQPIDSQALEGIAGKETAAALIASVVAERDLLLASRKSQRSALAATVASAEKELQALRERLDHLGLSLKDRADRLDVLNGVQSKGSLSPFSLYQARSEMAAVEEREDEVKGLLAQTELKLSQAEQDKMKLDVDAKIELERDLKDLEAEVSEEQLTISASRRLLAMAGQPIDRKSFGNLSYEIVRRTAQGPLQIAAKEMTVLEAGDLLKVTSPTALGSDQGPLN